MIKNQKNKNKKTFISTGLIFSAFLAASTLSCTESGYDYSTLNEANADVSSVVSPIGEYTSSKLNTLKAYGTGTIGAAIVGQGSSTVTPIINTIKSDYFSGMTYSGTGSGDGLKVGKDFANISAGAISGKVFGMTSSTKKPAAGDETNKWNTKVKTVTFGVDAIAIGLNLPNNLKITDNARPIIDLEELYKLYDNRDSTTTTWKDLLTNEDIEGSNTEVLNQKPLHLGRSGGKSASGTSDGFWSIFKEAKSSSFTDGNNDYDHDFIGTGTLKYGGETTAEANSAALNALKGKDGSLTYLSLGYAVKNQDKNMVVASIKLKTETWVPSVANVAAKSYKWVRPLNIIFSSGATTTKDTNKIGMQLAAFLLSTQGQKAVAKNAFIGLTKAQFKTQFGIVNNNDVTLAKIEEKLLIPDSSTFGLEF